MLKKHNSPGSAPQLRALRARGKGACGCAGVILTGLIHRASMLAPVL